MRVVSLPVTSDPLLELLYDFVVVDLKIDPGKVRRHGNLVADLEGAPPDEDLHMPHSEWRASLWKAELAKRVPRDVEVRSATYYPPGGGMGWHTNSGDPGWRLYVPHGPSGRMLSGLVSWEGAAGRVQHRDRYGYAHAFKVGHWRESWHAVYAHTARLVVGVRITDERARAMKLEAPL